MAAHIAAHVREAFSAGMAESSRAPGIILFFAFLLAITCLRPPTGRHNTSQERH